MAAYTKQPVSLGTVPGDKTGDGGRTAFTKVNDNFDVLYSAFTIDSTTFDVTFSGDIALSGSINIGTGLVRTDFLLDEQVQVSSNTDGQKVGYLMTVVGGTNNSRLGMYLDDTLQEAVWDTLFSLGNVDYVWKIGGTEELRLTTNGATFSGDIAIASASPTFEMSVAGTGDIHGAIKSSIDAGSGGKIEFETKRNGNTPLVALTLDDGQNALFAGGIALSGDTAVAANLLDDYEEGTWTPAWGGQGASPTSVTYFLQTGRYTKVGNLVTATCDLRISAITIGAASGAIQITGLPFTSTLMSVSAGGVGGGSGWVSGRVPQGVVVDTGTTTSRLSYLGTTSLTQMNVTDLSGDETIQATFTYYAT